MPPGPEQPGQYLLKRCSMLTSQEVLSEKDTGKNFAHPHYLGPLHSQENKGPIHKAP